MSMSRIEKRILGENVSTIVKLLKKAYYDKMQIFYSPGM
jgi:hypothetical protein